MSRDDPAAAPSQTRAQQAPADADPQTEASDFERVGAARLRRVIDDFVHHVVHDGMIGFFFAQVDPARLARHEYQFTARALGAKIPYEGKPIRAAHAPHPIMGGQFARRLWLLREALDRHDVPADIRDRLLEHTERLRPLVTRQAGSACVPDAPAGPLLVAWHPDDEAADAGGDAGGDAG